MVANGSSTVTTLTQTTTQLAQAYCKTPTSADCHSGAITVTSGVHCAKKNPTDTPNNYKGNQIMNTNINKPVKTFCGGYKYNGYDIMRDGRKFFVLTDRSENGMNCYRTFTTLKDCVAFIDKAGN